MHYGIFVCVQSSIFAASADIIPEGKGLLYFFFHWSNYITKDIGIMLSGFIISYMAGNFVPFILCGDYKTTSMMRLMFQPYGRIFIQQLTVILGSMFLAFGAGKVFILVFALAKIFVDVFINIDSILNKSAESMERQTGKTPTDSL